MASFFQRRRHLAGGKLMSLDDIEHEICDRDSLKARIHFAINCGSNGCPPIRASAFQAEGLHEMLQLATQQFLASEWNCRIDHDTRRIYVSRIFKMYAQDFAGASGTTRRVSSRGPALRRGKHRHGVRAHSEFRRGL